MRNEQLIALGNIFGIKSNVLFQTFQKIYIDVV